MRWWPVILIASPCLAPATCASDWVHERLATIDHDEMTELLLDVWRMVVPKKVWRQHAVTHDLPPD